jgi:hypothetical protein
MCDLRAGTLVGQTGTRVPFSDSQLSLTFPIEQFWGRAARASWVRKNPDARLIFWPPVVAIQLLRYNRHDACGECLKTVN